MVFLFPGCSPSLDELETATDPQVQSQVLVHTLHALIPGNFDEAYQMDLMIHPDGNVETIRKVVPFDANTFYFDYHLFGADGAQEVGDAQQVNFTGSAWFVPFDMGIEPSQVISMEGHITINCYCSGIGNCNAKVTYMPNGGMSAECVSRDCGENCNGEFTHATNGNISIPGVIVKASQVVTH